MRWQTQQDVTFRRLPDGASREGALVTDSGIAFERVRDESGDNQVSIWAFGAYEDLVQRQVDALEANLQAAGDTLAAGDAALTNTTVARDFRDAFLLSPGSVGTSGFVPIPMPNWSVRYSGLSDWPLLRRIAQSASLEHRYTSTYQSNFRSVSATGEVNTLQVGGSQVAYRRPDFNVEAAQVTEQFRPLLGVDITWRGGLQTNFDWNQNTDTFLRPAGLEVAERLTSELTFRASYSKRGLQIPFLPVGRLNNRVRFSLTVSRSVNDERNFNLRRALQDAASAGFDYDPAQATQGDNVNSVRETTRLTITPELSYQFSNNVSGNLVVKYEQFEGDGQQPSFTNIDGGFRVQVNISEY